MAEHDMIASVGIVPEQSSLNQTENVIATSVAKGFQKGAQRGLIQGINANAFSQPLGRITGKANEFEKSMAAANARVIAFGASTAPIFAMGAAFRKLIDSTIEVQKVMTGINAIFGLGAANLRTFTSQLFGVANQTGQSFNMAADAATEFARQGLNVQETLKRTSAALILNKISGLDMGEAVSSITSILNGFSKEALNSTDIINRMTSVDTQFAVSAGDLAEALKRVGASANDANVSFNQTLGLITAARQITGREGSVIGNSFKTMFTRLQRPEVLNDLEEAGIKVRDLNGKILPLIDVLKSLASTYNGLAASQKSFVSEAVGGVYQINILKGIMRDLSAGVSIYDNAVSAANNSTSAVTARMDKLNSTLSAGLVRTMNDLALASSNVGNALMGNSMKQGIGFFDNILQSTINSTNPDNKSGSAQTVQATIKGLGNFLAGPGLQVGFNIILKLLARLEEFVMHSGKDLLGLDSGGKERETLEKRYLAILSQEKEKIDEIINGKKTLNQMVAATVSLGIQDTQRNNLIGTLAKSAAAMTPRGLVESTNTTEIPNLAIGSVLPVNLRFGRKQYDINSDSFKYNYPKNFRELVEEQNIKYKGLKRTGDSNPFSSNSITSALSRENLATGGNARLSRSSQLISENNPLGLVAIDSRTQGNADEAIQQHKVLGQTLTQIKSTKSVPHLSTGIDMSLLLSTFGYAGQLAQSSDKIHKFVDLFPVLFSATEKEIYAKRKLVEEYDKMSKDLLTTGKSQSFYGSKFSNLGELSGSPLSKEMESFRTSIREFTQQQDSERKSLLGYGFKIANYSSFGGAALSQAAGNASPTAAASVDDLQAGVTAAGQALIAFPNKIGGALAAGLTASGIINAFSTLTVGVENQRQAADLELARLKDVNENLRTLSQTSSDLTNLYNDAGTSIETISRESRKYSETLAQLSQLQGGADMARKIALAPNADARQGVIQDLLGEQSKRAETVASLVNAQELFAKRSFFGVNHIPGVQSNQGGYTYQNEFEKDTVKSQLVENAGVAISNMSDTFKTALLDSVTDLGQFSKVLNSFSGGGADDVRSYLGQIKKSGGAPAYDEVIQEIRSLLTEKNLYENNPEVSKALDASRSKLEGKQLNIDNATKNQQYIRRLFVNQGALQASNLLDVREQSLRSSYGSESVRLSGLQAFSPLFSQQNGERTIAQREYGIGVQDLASNTRNQLSSLNINTNRKLMDELTQNFDENLAKSTKSGTGPNITGEKNLSISENRSLLISAINNGLSSVLKSSGGNVIGKYSTDGQFNFQAFAKEAARSGSSNPIISSQVEKYLNSQQSIDILKTLNNSNLEQNRILQDFKDKSLEEQQKLNAAIAEADFKQLNSYFGGIQSLLDRGSARSIMREETRGFALMNNGGSPEAKAQGASMLLKSLQSQGFVMSDNNPLIAKAHQVFDTQGAATYQKYAGRMIGMASGMFGSDSAEARGLSQGYNQNLGQVLENQYKAAFKPEGAAGSENFVNSSEIIKPFNDGLIQSTQSLNDFPAAIATTVEALKSASSGIESAKKSYDATLQQVDKGLEDIMASLQAKYGEAAKSAEPQQQTDYLSWTKEFGPAVGTLIATAIGTAINNLIFSKFGGSSFKNIIGSFSSKLPKGEAASEIAQVTEAVESSGANVVQAIGSGTRTSFNGTRYGGSGGAVVENELSSEMSAASKSWRETLSATPKGRMRVNIPTKFPSTVISDIDSVLMRYQGNTGEAPKIFKSGSINPPKMVVPKLLRMGNINKGLDLISKSTTESMEQLDILTKQYQTNLEKIAQDIHLGKETLIKINGENVNFAGWKGIGKSSILERLSEMGMSSKSFKESGEQDIYREAYRKFDKLSNFEKNVKSINFDRESSANATNRDVFSNYRQGSIVNVREQQYRERLHGDFRESAVRNSMAEKARTPANLLRQTFLRKSVEEKQFAAWQRIIARNNASLETSEFIPGTVLEANGESAVPEGMLNSTGNKAFTSAGITSKAQNASISRLFNNLKSYKGLASFSGVKAGFSVLNEMSGKIPSVGVFNPLSVSAFKQAGSLGKGLQGLGVLGLAATGYQAVQDYGEAARGGSYVQATGKLANNLIGFAGPIGIAGSLVNRAVMAGTNKAIDYHLQSVEGQGSGDYLDMYRKNLPRLQAAQKRRQNLANAVQAGDVEKQQAQIAEDMANDPTHAQGKARQTLLGLSGPLSSIDRKDKFGNTLGLSQFSKQQKGTLEGIYRVLHPEDKNDTGFNANFGRYVAGHGDEVEKKLTGYYGKNMPTWMNDRSYTDGNGKTHARTLSEPTSLANPSVVNSQQDTQANQMKDLIDTLKGLTSPDKGTQLVQQHVDFDALPININVNANTTTLPDDAKKSVNTVIADLQGAIQDLKSRMTKLDGVTAPSKVS